MNIKNIIKKQTTVIAIAVVMVAVTAIGVSYSLFFDVKSSDKNQVVTAGTLNVTFNKESIKEIQADVLTDGEGLKSTPISYTINNSGNLPATYKLYMALEEGNSIDASLIKVSTSNDEQKGNDSKALTGLPTVNKIDSETGTFYQIGEGNVGANANSKTQYFRVWISEGDNAISGTIKLKLYVVSEVNEAAATQN